MDDYWDVGKADLLIAFSEPTKSTTASRGGRHVEFGMALARGTRVMVVGPYENIFHRLPMVEHFAKWEDALAELAGGA